MFVHSLEGLARSKGPIELIVRDVVSLKEDFFEHEFDFLIVRPFIEVELVSVFEQRVEKLGLGSAKVSRSGCDFVLSYLLELL